MFNWRNIGQELCLGGKNNKKQHFMSIFTESIFEKKAMELLATCSFATLTDFFRLSSFYSAVINAFFRKILNVTLITI